MRKISKSLKKKSKKFRRELRKNRTKAEKIVFDYLKKSRVHFVFQKIIYEPFHRIADFYIPSLKLIIEIDGAGHTWDDGIVKDRQKDEGASKRGIKTVRITNKQVYKGEHSIILDPLVEKALEIKQRKIGTYVVKPKKIFKVHEQTLMELQLLNFYKLFP